jgi:tRNA (cytidine/uridine-2'-O-)-methyltransferase
VKLIEHDSYDHFLQYIKQPYSIYYLTRFGVNTPNQMRLKANRDIYFMFGKESAGISKDILRKNKSNTVRIPSSVNVRSLNLSNCVAIMGYEYARQNEYHGLEKLEPHKSLF